MENDQYTQARYTVTVLLDMPADELFRVITVELGGWWPEEIRGGCTAPDVEFELFTADSHYSRNRVIEWIPGGRVVWLVTDSLRKLDGHRWTGTRMIFDLLPRQGATELSFTYDGPVPKEETGRLAEVCDSVIRDRLYHYVEHRRGHGHAEHLKP